MAKKERAKPETKSEFLRKVLGRNPDLDYQQVNRRWAKAGHAGEISNALYYKVRGELGIRTEWVWVKEDVVNRDEAAPTGHRRGLPVQDHAPGHPAPDLAANPGEGLHAGQAPRAYPDGDGLDQLAPVISSGSTANSTAIPMLLEESFEELGYGDSTRRRLSDILPENGGRFRFEYEYDFGDGWLHEVLFEGRRPAESGKRNTALCLEGARACPPEDVVRRLGLPGFPRRHPESETRGAQEMREWIGGKFDPEAFAVSGDEEMKKGLPDW